MNLIGTDLTPKQIQDIIVKLTELVGNCHSGSITLYPDPKYQQLDTLGVNYQKHLLTLENILSQWQIESKYQFYIKESEYFKQRLKQLQDFYLKSREEDRKDLTETMAALQEKYLERLRLCETLNNTPFHVHVSKDLQLLINKI